MPVPPPKDGERETDKEREPDKTHAGCRYSKELGCEVGDLQNDPSRDDTNPCHAKDMASPQLQKKQRDITHGRDSLSPSMIGNISAYEFSANRNNVHASPC